MINWVNLFFWSYKRVSLKDFNQIRTILKIYKKHKLLFPLKETITFVKKFKTRIL